MNGHFQAPLRDYEKVDIVRRAITDPSEWINPFPDLSMWELQTAERNLREVLNDIRLAKVAYRIKEAEFRRERREQGY